MKDKIIEILEKYSKELVNTHYNEDVVFEDDFEEIAEDIERLFFDNLDDELKESLENHLKQLRQDQ